MLEIDSEFETTAADMTITSLGSIDPSGRSAIVVRYLEMCRRHRPKLTVSEWHLLCDAQAGSRLTERSIKWIDALVTDAIVLDGLDVKWGVNGDELKARVRSWRYAECLAVQMVVDTFWRLAGDDPGGDSPQRLLEGCAATDSVRL